jgi:DNA-binding SARP family transcriptional activator
MGIDLVDARDLAHRVIGGETRSTDIASASITHLSFDLLPDWYDDWVILEAEEWRQLRLHALEALSDRFARGGRHPDAVAAAMAAVKGDPLRESARVVLVKAHLAENNPSEALREIQRYRRLLHEQLGLKPSPIFMTLLENDR